MSVRHENRSQTALIAENWDAIEYLQVELLDRHLERAVAHRRRATGTVVALSNLIADLRFRIAERRAFIWELGAQ